MNNCDLFKQPSFRDPFFRIGVTTPLPFCLLATAVLCAWTADLAVAQPGGFGGPGPGGGGPNSPDLELVEEFDADKDGVLNSTERAKARKSLKNRPQNRRGGGPPGAGGRSRGRGGPGGRGGNRPEGKPGPKVSPSDVTSYPDADLYDPSVLRTIFLDFEQDDWEQELADFKPTDVEVPAKITVDGKTYPNVGVSFRGSSSFFMVPAGSKRSFNLSMDFMDEDQRLYGYKTLNFLNGNGDASLMSSYLYSYVTSKKIATPKVNFVKVVVNGRSWGIYTNAQQFNKDFLKDNYDTKKGARWKVSGSPRGDAGLRYLGEDQEPYRERFDIKSKDKDESWQDLIHLCKVLNETPADQLEEALEPILDLDGVLWFLAADVALINSDGYWTRASDYSLYQDKDGKFHVIPHDMNESFRASRGGPGGGPGGPGGGPGGGRRGRGGGFDFLFGPPPGAEGGPPPGFDRGPGSPPEGRRHDGRPQDGPSSQQRQPRGNRSRGAGPGNDGPPDQRQGGGNRGGTGYELDPLVNSDNDRFPLRTKLLANENLKTRYLQNLRFIAKEMLAWDKVGPLVIDARNLIDDEVKADTRKLMTYEQFQNATSDRVPAPAGSLREFCEKRAEFLLNHSAIKNLPDEPKLNRTQVETD